MMDHNYLDALMHGELLPNKKSANANSIRKTKLENDLEKEIDAYVDDFKFEENSDQKTLLDPKAKRERMRREIKEAIKLPELSEQIEKAIGLLTSEGSQKLSQEANQKLISELSAASSHLSNLGLQEAGNQTLQSLTKISDESMNSVAEIAMGKFEEALYGDSQALFSFLSILNPGYSEYWLRLGITAQKSGNSDLASRAYAATLALEPDNLGARLFGAECFIQRGLQDEAKVEVAAAKNIIENTETDKMWKDLLADLESSLKSKHK